MFSVLFGTIAEAKTYKVYIGLPAGSATDVKTRKIFSEVEKITGDNYIILNRPGNGLMISYKSFVEDSKKDNDIILYIGGTMIVSCYITNKELDCDPFNEVKFLTPMLNINFYVLVNEDSNIKTSKDIKGKLNVGYSNFMNEVLFKKTFNDPNLNTILYKSDNDVITALLKKEIDVASVLSSNTLHKSHQDKLRALHVYPKNFINPQGYAVSPSFPEDERKKLISALSRVIRDPDMVKFLENDSIGSKVDGGTPEHFENLARSLVESFSKFLTK